MSWTTVGSRWPALAAGLLLGVGSLTVPAWTPDEEAQSFDRGEFLAAMNRLHEYYKAPAGLQRPNGLSIGGSPDFAGIATWIFDVYLTCRAALQPPEDSWNEVVARITQTEEWRSKHPGEPSLQPRGCTSPTRFDSNDFLQAMQRLDTFYKAPGGLQRPNGLSLDGVPDFPGIAAWIFDVYLNARLAGRSGEVAWSEVVRSLEGSDEWRTRHPEAATTLRFAVIGDFGLAGDRARDVSMLVKSWNVDVIITTGDNNYMNGAAATLDTNVGQYYSDFIFPYLGSFGSTSARNRFFPVLGNHDWEVAGAAPYLNYFALPGNERYYEFVQPPVHFFALDSDPNEPDGIFESSVQAQWLRSRLAASTLPYRFVYMHHAPFSSSLNGSHGSLQWPYASWGASAVLAGHDHTYERVMRDNTPYFVNGAGGYALYQFISPVIGSAVRYNADHGAMLVEVDRTGATFKFINRGGAVVDSHVVAPRSVP